MGSHIPIGHDDLFDTSVPVSKTAKYKAAKADVILIVRKLQKAKKKQVSVGRFSRIIDQTYRDILCDILVDLNTDGILVYSESIIPNMIKLK